MTARYLIIEPTDEGSPVVVASAATLDDAQELLQLANQGGSEDAYIEDAS